MLKNYFLIAIRNLKNYKGYSLINILGLSIGIACCVIIMLYVRNEISFDQYHEKADRIYRIEYCRRFADKEIHNVRTPAQWAPALKNDYPAIADFVRLKPPRSRWMVKYEDRLFFEKGFVFADWQRLYSLLPALGDYRLHTHVGFLLQPLRSDEKSIQGSLS